MLVYNEFSQPTLVMSFLAKNDMTNVGCVILSEAKNLSHGAEILRFAQNDIPWHARETSSYIYALIRAFLLYTRGFTEDHWQSLIERDSSNHILYFSKQ